ncbi:SALT STRESS RESPONSE/ANTIFUNGAL DOMAIN PROTEIN [Salix viminalis]|uniref:SALT STRESS RESPONSE/ANTIFUNGAL DOMAIN PROTEIN n=1 Tax=Salix viminalis TaxID=40686 RepID=A0A9Q0U8G6_SALVM|nr:SALT STRESS RESPONSE/ANTIFUNGAL DOMAIN PROTEIN [Salix viminalis]
MFLLLNPTSFLSLLITIITLISSTASQPTYTYHFCSDPQNSTENTNYDSNLSALLSSLSSKASLNSFYQDSSNGIYSLYLCRGDVSNNTCQTCINNATKEIQRQCASNGTAIIWYDECMLRYSIKNFLGVSQTSPRLLMSNTQNTTSPDEKNIDALALIYPLIVEIPYTKMMYGTDNKSASHDGSPNTYALVQCSRDINSSNCRSCLEDLNEAANRCCKSKIGWRILAPSCSLRYEEYEFYQPPSTPVPVPSAPGPEPVPGESNTKTWFIKISERWSIHLP